MAMPTIQSMVSLLPAILERLTATPLPATSEPQ